MESKQPPRSAIVSDATARKVTPNHVSSNVEQVLHADMRARVQLVKSSPAMQMSDLCSAALQLIVATPGWESLVIQRAFDRALDMNELHPKYNRVPLHEGIIAQFTALYESQRGSRPSIIFQTGAYLSAALSITLDRSDAVSAIRAQVLRNYSNATFKGPPLPSARNTG